MREREFEIARIRVSKKNSPRGKYEQKKD